MRNRFVVYAFVFLVALALLTPFLVFKDLLFPFVTSKAFFLRMVVELALPLYVFLLLSEPKYRPNLKNPVTIAVGAFFLFNLLAGLFGITPIRSLWGNFERMGGVFYLAHVILLYFYVLLIGQARTTLLRIFLQWLVVIGVAVSLDAVFILLTHNHFLLPDPSYPRISGTFGNPIFIASFLVVPTFVAIFLAFGTEMWWKKFIYYSVALLQTWAIFLSGTRGAVVGLGIGMFAAAVLYVLLAPSKKIRRWGGASVLLFGCIIGALFMLHSRLPPGSMLHRVFNLNDTNTQARIIQWKTALKGFPDHPLLGVGPENYYIISNKYYNPEIYQYDPSWFDKPHNYILEILVTSGALGFLAYGAMLIFSLGAFWRSFKRDIISLEEFCVLVCALLTYEVQNLFVFDTVAASMAFFIFVGLAGILWHEADRAEHEKKNRPQAGYGRAFVAVAVGLATLLAGYCLYMFNIGGMRVAKAVNYGFAYGPVDSQKAENFFQTALSDSFNFDPIQTANKYAEFASQLSQNPGKAQPDVVRLVVSHAIAAENDAIAKISNDPVAYQELTTLYIDQALQNKQLPGQDAYTAIQTAMSLAPLRPDPALAFAQLQIYQNNIDGAQNTLETVVNNVPTDANAKLQLSQFYFLTGQYLKAKASLEQLLSSSFVPTGARQIDWAAQLYVKLDDLQSAAKIYELALKIEPSNIDDFWQLANIYAKIGKKDAAISMAQEIAKYDPSRSKSMQDFIDSLQ